MKHSARLSIMFIFVLLILQTSLIQASEYSQGWSVINNRVSIAEVGDIDGDGYDDLVYIYAGSTKLATGISFSSGDSFSGIYYDTSRWYGAIGGSLYIEDVNGDQYDDIFFVLQEEHANLATVFISNGDGSFRDAVTQELVIDESLDYHIQGGDINGDHRFDLIFSAMINNGTENTTVILKGQSDGSFQ